MSSQFLDFLRKSPLPLLSDGAMGTMLAAHGPKFDQCLDCLNLYKPESVTEVHRQYIQAGAQVIQTNTFGANRFKLAQYGLSNQAYQINRSGVDLAVSAARSATQKIFVAGDVGPLGVRLAPYGRVQPDQARQAFCEQITALTEAGVDLIILETFTDLSEIIEAIASARQVCALPVVASLTFTRDDLTLLGDTPRRAAQELVAAGADLIGVNCSGGPAQIWRISASDAPGSSYSKLLSHAQCRLA